jgi:hypothetical protein
MGTETTRPSVSVIESESFEHETSTANTSDLSAEILMPFLQEELRILDNNFPEIRNLVRAKTLHVGERHRLKPRHRIPSGMRHVDVRWLASLHAEKEEPIAPDSEESGHLPSLPPPAGSDSGPATLRCVA